jgi:hypothetical protein
MGARNSEEKRDKKDRTQKYFRTYGQGRDRWEAFGKHSFGLTLRIF